MIQKGESRSHLVGLNDIFVTVSDLSSIKVPIGQVLDSASFAEYALNGKIKEGLREYLGAWVLESDKKKKSSIRNGNMKLVHDDGIKVTELYDLSNVISADNNDLI